MRERMTKYFTRVVDACSAKFLVPAPAEAQVARCSTVPVSLLLSRGKEVACCSNSPSKILCSLLLSATRRSLHAGACNLTSFGLILCCCFKAQLSMRKLAVASACSLVKQDLLAAEVALRMGSRRPSIFFTRCVLQRAILFSFASAEALVATYGGAITV
jgi:hypothetical protein